MNPVSEARGRRLTTLLSQRPLAAFGPVLALGTGTAVLAAFAGSLGWYRTQMFALAAVTIGAVLAFATILLYRQTREQRVAQRALREIEARVGGIVESAMDAIITVDEGQHIVLFNAAAEQMFSCPREEAMGAPLSRFIPERYRASHGEHIRRFGDTKTTSRRMGEQRIVTGLRRNGEEFPIDASISQITENSQKFYTVILRDVTRRVQADEALRRSKEELRQFTAAADLLREQEKRRIARELHDELAQALTGLKMDIAWIQQKLPSPPQPVADKLKSMETLLDSTVAATRRISADLRPMMLDDLGLVPATEWLVQNFTERTGIKCKLSISNPDLDLQDPFATALYRVMQESLTNIAKHAQATNVEVAIVSQAGEIRISVRDDGKGFSLDQPRKSDSYGLIGLRERVHLLGGTVEIDSAPGNGTRIDARIPATRGDA